MTPIAFLFVVCLICNKVFGTSSKAPKTTSKKPVMERPRNFSFQYRDTSKRYQDRVAQLIQQHNKRHTKYQIMLLDSGVSNGGGSGKFYPNNPKDRTEENCYLIGFKPGHTETFIHQLLELMQPESLTMFGSSSCNICFPDRELPLSLLQSLSFVDYIERDCNVSASQLQKNPPWNLDRLDKVTLPLNNTYAFERTGRGVNVYVVDSGIDEKHPEFGGRAKLLKSFLNDPSDCAGHGTQVSSLIAGTNVGVAKLANIWSVKILDCKGNGKNAHLIGAVYWIIQNHQKPAIINMSVGGIASKAIDKAVEDAYNAGILVISAAGNNDADACLVSPSGSPMALNVGSFDEIDRKAPFSNWGSCVDILAPGTNIVAAIPSTGRNKTSKVARYTFSSGTSLSAPMVTGVAAQILESNPQITPDLLKSTIFESSAINILKGNTLKGTINRILQQPRNIGSSGVKIKTKEVIVRDEFRYSDFDLSNSQSSDRKCKTWVWIFVPFMIALGVILVAAFTFWFLKWRQSRAQIQRTNRT